jgi:hypothetical protein
MSGKTIAILLCAAPFAALAHDRPQFGPPGYELPARITPMYIEFLHNKIVDEKCNKIECHAIRLAVYYISDNSSGRKAGGTIWNGRPHKDIPYGAIKAREIDDSLRKYMKIWPALCRAVVEIGARDDFDDGIKNYAWIASAALDVARHLTHPGLDCLGQALAAMPPSRYLQYSMHGAWAYCLDERRGEAHCARLKPTDPEFLPVGPGWPRNTPAP